MSTADKIIKALEDADRATAALVPFAQRIAGLFGKSGGPRWHRWCCFRLRLRASRIEAGRRRSLLDAAQRAKVVIDLRQRAAEHLKQACSVVGGADDATLTDVAILHRGCEPEALRA